MADAYDMIVIGGGPGGYVAAIRDSDDPSGAATQLRQAFAAVGEEAPGG